MAKKSEGNGHQRFRNYATVVYADSAPENWQEILSAFLVPAFISPYHDSDLNPDETPKKAHWHVLLAFDGVKTIEQAKEIFDSIHGVGCEIVQSFRGYARYLCHLDNPEKHQYDVEQVKCLCGADYQSAIDLPTDRYKAIREMIAFCDANVICNFADLLEYAMDNRMDWFRILCDSGTYILKEYLKAKVFRNSDNSHYNPESPASHS